MYVGMATGHQTEGFQIQTYFLAKLWRWWNCDNDEAGPLENLVVTIPASITLLARRNQHSLRMATFPHWGRHAKVSDVSKVFRIGFARLILLEGVVVWNLCDGNGCFSSKFLELSTQKGALQTHLVFSSHTPVNLHLFVFHSPFSQRQFITF